MASFQVVHHEGTHGPTVYVEVPRVEALKYKAMLMLRMGRKTVDMVSHEDGHITVSSPGLMDLTFAPA